MKHILLTNAHKSWQEAIESCELIKKGYATLGNKKRFVSALQNTLELVLKQAKLDDGEHDVAYIRDVINLGKATLAVNYYSATDLNAFFSSLSSEDRNYFFSIEFSRLIDYAKKSLNLPDRESLKLLASMRNNETHFYIDNSYLSEPDFVTLHNLMLDLDAFMERRSYVPHIWGMDCSGQELRFGGQKISAYSYKDALKKQMLTTRIFNALNDNPEATLYYGDAYDLANYLCESDNGFENEFDRVVDTIEMFEEYSAISIVHEDFMENDITGQQDPNPTMKITI